jgi:hypothetical protein
LKTRIFNSLPKKFSKAMNYTFAKLISKEELCSTTTSKAKEKALGLDGVVLKFTCVLLGFD